MSTTSEGPDSGNTHWTAPGSEPAPVPPAPTSWPTPVPPPAPPGYPGAVPEFRTFPTGVGCQACSTVPALTITARAHRGLLVVMQNRHVSGTFCRDCGTSITRQLSSETLVQGWWGIFSVLITPVVLLINAVTLRRLARLPQGTVSTPGMRPPQPPGRSLWRRPSIAGLLVPVLGAALVAVGVYQSSRPIDYAPDARPVEADVVERAPAGHVGDCWSGSADDGFRKVACTSEHTVQVFWVGTARTFSSYRKAGEQVRSGSAQADAACEAAFPDAAWTDSAPDDLYFSDIFPGEEALDSPRATHDDLEIVCFVDSVRANASTISLIKTA